jgi:XTP/dITP diphosphohydrolase
MIRIVLATSNPGKLQELAALTQDLPITFIPQDTLGVEPPEETGLTFVENAILKARYAAQITGLPALADDSGLEVDALDGAPGIYSARYAGEGQPGKAHIDKLLKALHDTPPAKRKARFRSVLVLMRHPLDPAPIIAEGIWEGRILTTPQGTGGFGYDPVFVPDKQQDNRSAAELSPIEKNAQSHRGQALAQLHTRLMMWLDATI